MTDAKRPWGVHTIHDVMGSPNCEAGLSDGRYVRAVPEPYTANKLVAAWWVLTGRAYALVWPKSGDLEAAWGFPERKHPFRPYRPYTTSPMEQQKTRI